MSAPWIVAFAALWASTLLVAAVVLGLLRRVTTVLEAAEAAAASAVAGPDVGGAEPGAQIPPFEARIDGEGPLPSSELLKDGAVLLFMEAGCEPCATLAARLDGIGERIDGVPLYVVLEDSPDAHELPLPPTLAILYQREQTVSQAFGTRATPQAFAVDAAATVLERRVPGTVTHLRDLARHCNETRAATSILAPSRGR